MSERKSIHDGWTPQPQEQGQPGDPLAVPADPPSPLTAEAEKQVRAMAADTYDLTGLSDPMYATTALLLGALRKTLATLDAARAPAPAGLDAQWGALLEDIIGLWATGQPDKDDVLDVLAEYRAATRPAPAGPDVETLNVIRAPLARRVGLMTMYPDRGAWRKIDPDLAAAIDALDALEARAATRPAEDADR